MATSTTPANASADDTPATAPDTAPQAGVTPSPDGPTGAVWDALMANPGASVADIATAAALPQQATRRALTALELDGHATRTPGGRKDGKRAPDAWHPISPAGTGTADTDTQAEPDTTDEADGHAPTPDTSGEPPTDTPPEMATDGTAEDDNGNEEDVMDAAAVTEATDALASLAVVISEALHGLDTGDRTAALAAAEAIYAGSGKARRLVRAAANGRPRSASGRAKSHPGELRAKVAAHLAAYPGKEFTPHEVAKAIGHSAGAVANALDRLTALSDAVATCDRPRRFTAATDTGDGADASADSPATAAATA